MTLIKASESILSRLTALSLHKTILQISGGEQTVLAAIDKINADKLYLKHMAKELEEAQKEIVMLREQVRSVKKVENS